jgi:hypothetical protein
MGLLRAGASHNRLVSILSKAGEKTGSDGTNPHLASHGESWSAISPSPFKVTAELSETISIR